MRHLMAGAAAAVAATLAGTLIAASSEAAPDRTIRLLDRTTDEKLLDLDHSGGFSPGDVNISTSNQLDAAGRTVGFANTRVSVFYGHVLVDGVVTLAGRGQITFAGADDLDPARGRLAVTGGTGEFKNARGVLRFTTIDDRDTRLTIRLGPQ